MWLHRLLFFFILLLNLWHMKWKKNTPGYSEFCFLTKAVGQGQAYFRRWNERNPQTLLQHLEYIYIGHFPAVLYLEQHLPLNNACQGSID